jgi:hypothetical protein
MGYLRIIVEIQTSLRLEGTPTTIRATFSAWNNMAATILGSQPCVKYGIFLLLGAVRLSYLYSGMASVRPHSSEPVVETTDTLAADFVLPMALPEACDSAYRDELC